MIVVMRLIDGQDLAEMALAEDELLVQALSAQGANESLSGRVRAGSSDRGFNDPSANGSEDRVEGLGELCVSVPDEELELASLPQVIEQVTGKLAHPRPSGDSGHTQDVHPTGLYFQDEEDVEPPEQDGARLG